MLCQSQFYESNKRIDLPDEEPEVFSSVLEYLYKGDYYPRLEFDKRRQSWQLEDGTNPERQSTIESTVFMNGVGVVVLKDTVIYVCSSPLLHAAHHANTMIKVHSREIWPPRTPAPRSAQTGSSIWNPMFHHPHQRPLCLRQHTRQ